MRTTDRRLAADGKVTGWPALGRLVGSDVVDRAREWLGVTVAAVATVSAVSAVSAPGSPGVASPIGTRVPVPGFPVEALPEPVCRFLSTSAAALDCPPELVAVPFLALAAGCLGNRFTIQLTQSWIESAILWSVVVAPPGSAKSPAMRMALEPINRLQSAAHRRFTDALTEYEQALRQRRGQSVGGETAAPAFGERPEEEHYYSTDSTLEAIAKMLGHPHSCTPGFTMTRDELVSWVKSFDAYSSRGERQSWLSLWTGASLKVDRASRDSYFVERPAVSVCGGVQPDLLSALQAEAGARDGFLERMLFAYPETRPMRLVDAALDDRLIEEVVARLRRLRASAPEGVVALTSDAFRLFQTWHEENCTAQERTAGLIQGTYAKLPSQAGRLALVLHCLTHPDHPAGVSLSAATMAAALALAEYHRAHAHKVLAHFGVAAQLQDSLAVRVLDALERVEDVDEGGPGVTTTALRAALGGHVPSGALRAALEALQRAGLLRVEPILPGERGGRPGHRWRRCRDEPGAETAITVETFTFGPPRRHCELCLAPVPTDPPGLIQYCPYCVRDMYRNFGLPLPKHLVWVAEYKG